MVVVTPASLVVAATVVVPCCKVKVAGVIVKGSIASLKAAAIFPLMATPVAALAGTVKLTVGAVVSAGIANPMILESRVTAPVRANSRPSTAAPVVTVMEANARMLPLNTEPVPRVAELPTCQNTLAALAPPLRITWRAEVVVRVDAIWKMKTALASPWASSVRSPEEISSEEVDLYRPGVRVCPPRLPAIVIAPTVRPAASLYAVVKASCAWAAAGSPAWIVPLTVPGGNPVTAVPGLTPRSPLTVVAPVLVTVEPARTANVVAAPRATGACPAGVTAVVKLQTKFAASALPARSLVPVVTVAVYTARGARALAGVKVGLLLLT